MRGPPCSPHQERITQMARKARTFQFTNTTGLSNREIARLQSRAPCVLTPIDVQEILGRARRRLSVKTLSTSYALDAISSSATFSRMTSILNALRKRHGGLLEFAIRLGLKRACGLVVGMSRHSGWRQAAAPSSIFSPGIARHRASCIASTSSRRSGANR
jgi:hypothetical protein